MDPPFILPVAPYASKVGHDFLGEETDVLHRLVARHVAELEQEHEVANVEAFDQRLHLIDDRLGAAGDDIALFDVFLPAEPRLTPGERLDRLGTRLRAADRRVAGSGRKALIYMEATLVEIM